MPAASSPECPPSADDAQRVRSESGDVTLRMPPVRGTYNFDSCRRVRSLSASYIWRDGKLSPPSQGWAYDEGVQVYAATFETLEKARSSIARWRFDKPGVPHARYPLDLYPVVEIWPGGPSLIRRYEWKVWSLRGTRDEASGRPFTAGCQIGPLDPSRPESAVSGDFPASNPDARCRISVHAVRGHRVIGAAVHIWKRSAPWADEIAAAVADELAKNIVDE
jgi:hypothetical protein